MHVTLKSRIPTLSLKKAEIQDSQVATCVFGFVDYYRGKKDLIELFTNSN